MLTIDRVIELKGVIKWNALYAEAGLNPNTMRSAVHYRRELRREEAAALVRALSRRGITLSPIEEPTLFEELEGVAQNARRP